MKTYKVLVPFVIYLIIAVGMLGIYKWADEALSYRTALAWAFYAGFRALYLSVLGEKAVRQLRHAAVDQPSLMLMTIVVGIIPFIFLGWLGCLAAGCVSFAFEYHSYRLVRKYTWSINYGRHHDQR